MDIEENESRVKHTSGFVFIAAPMNTADPAPMDTHFKRPTQFATAFQICGKINFLLAKLSLFLDIYILK